MKKAGSLRLFFVFSVADSKLVFQMLFRLAENPSY